MTVGNVWREAGRRWRRGFVTRGDACGEIICGPYSGRRLQAGVHTDSDVSRLKKKSFSSFLVLNFTYLLCRFEEHSLRHFLKSSMFLRFDNMDEKGKCVFALLPLHYSFCTAGKCKRKS